MEVDKSHGSSRLLSHLPMWSSELAFSTCAAMIILGLYFPYLSVSIGHGICSTIS